MPAEAEKPQEMVTPYRPALPITVPGTAWSDSLPVVDGVSASPAPFVGFPAVPALAAPPVQDPLGDADFAVPASEDEEDEEESRYPLWLLNLADDAPYWLGSLIVHMVAFLLLSMVAGNLADEPPPETAVSGPDYEAADPLGEVRPQLPASYEMAGPPVRPEDQNDEPPEPVTVEHRDEEFKDQPRSGLADANLVEPVSGQGSPLVAFSPATPSLANLDSGPLRIGDGIGGLDYGLKSDLVASLDRAPMVDSQIPQGVLSGRGDGARGELVVAAGGTPGSERAVGAALKWLAAHQLPDGGWDFNHTKADSCKGQCRNPGGMSEARNAATAMALLPFLGAGQTHQQGRYMGTVERGLDFLLEHMKDGPEGVPRGGKKRRKPEKLKAEARGATFFEPGGRMYSHGLASIALCEAYAMTHDKDLRQPAQECLDFICFAQDPKGGGWRYRPQEQGDTSMVGWQLMALKSGRMAYLRVPGETTAMAMKYLDRVQTPDGANYGYQHPEARDATTAIGLLSRMYLGWNKDNPGLAKGVEWLGARGPSPNNMYYNYYATQVMRHWEGEPWRRWNMAMRDQLTDTQAKTGHETGSWFLPGSDHGAGPGGRLYFTALAAMTLEIYYRYLPLYRTQSVEEVEK